MREHASARAWKSPIQTPVHLFGGCGPTVVKVQTRTYLWGLLRSRATRPTAGRFYEDAQTSSVDTHSIASRKLPKRNAGSAPIQSTRITQTIDQSINSNVQQMSNQKRCGSAGGSLNHERGGGPDVEGEAQRHQPICQINFSARESVVTAE